MSKSQEFVADQFVEIEEDNLRMSDLTAALLRSWKTLMSGTLAAGLLGLGVAYLIPPTFTAQTLFLPPQQPQSSAASALSSLGALSGLAGSSLGGKTTGDQYVSLLQSANVQDRLIDRFKLMDVYEVKYRSAARTMLSQNVRISLGKKDGLIAVAADAHSPEVAADLANAHVSELRRLTGELALTEAQQRRVFFEGELKRTREQLADAQRVLQQSGFNPGALKAEPKAAAESYAKIKAEVTTAEIRLQTMRRALAEGAPEIQQQQTLIGALRGQLAKLEGNETADLPKDGDYVNRYRDYKYQESLFELFSRQYEAARLDESREGSLIQVIDTATPPDRKSKPQRALIAIGATLGGFVTLSIILLMRHFRRKEKAS